MSDFSTIYDIFYYCHASIPPLKAKRVTFRKAGFYSFHRRKTLNHLVRTYLINYMMILLAEGGQFYKTP